MTRPGRVTQDAQNQVAVRGNPVLPNPSLDGWAHFSFGVTTRNGRLFDQTGYDDKTHSYRQSYVNPRTYQLVLSMSDGMLHGADPINPSLRVLREPRPMRPGDLSDMDRVPLTPPVGGGVHGGGSELIPKNIIAFQWTVTGDNSFHSRQILTRAEASRAGVEFTIPGTGDYTVNLWVVFNDGTYGQQTADFTLRDFLFVSIGDSFASGEGNPDSPGLVRNGEDWKCDAATISRATDMEPKMHIEARWVEKLAHRSLKGAHALAAGKLHRPSGRTLDRDGSRFALDRITFVSAARSGAGVIEGLFNSQTQPPNKDFIGVGQLQEVQRTVAGRQIDALEISIGGNDTGFSGVLADLVKGDNVFTANDDNAPAAVEARIDGRLVQLDANYDRLKADIDTRLHPGAVYINGYPTALFDKTKPDGSVGFHACGLFQGWDLDIDAPDYALIQKKGKELNTLIQNKAAQFGWHYIDIAPDFVGRGYCDSNTLWVGASESCRGQGDFEGVIHPSNEAHHICAQRFVAQMRTHTVM